MKAFVEKEKETPLLLEGGLAVDERGEVGFVNGFDMSRIKRFYTVTNHKEGFIRAWHAHKNESKYVAVIDGTAVIAAVEIDDWERPSKDLKIHRYVLSSKKPAVLYIPEGHAHGYMTFGKNAKLIFFSTSTLEESQRDDIRYNAYYWNPWEVIER